jgi:hypothetical protein
MLATMGGGSANGFGRGGGAAALPLFNEHGIFGIEFPNSGNLNNTVTLTEVFTYGQTGLSGGQQANRAQLIDGAAAGFDPLNAGLITAGNDGHNSGNAAMPVRMSPISGRDWSTVSSPGHIDTTYIGSQSSASGMVASYGIGGALYTDATSTQVISKRVHYAPNTGSDYSQGSTGYIKNSSGGYSVHYFDMPSSTNYHGRGASTRFNRGHSSTEGMLVNFVKDQSGYLENVSGMPNVWMANVLDASGGLINPQSTQSATARTSYNLGSSNTHGNSNRGAFLGGRKVGNTHESFFVGVYSGYTSNSYDGMRFIKVTQDLTTRTVTTQVGDNIHVDVNGDNGDIIYANQVYPHAHFIINNHSNSYVTNNHSSSKHYYVDLSQTWGNTNNSLAYDANSGSVGSHFSRVGNTVGGDGVYFYFDTSYAWIKAHNVTNNNFPTDYARASIFSNHYNTNGVFPIPETNRILVSNQLGFTLYEMNIP